jgi:hypothetical protein
MSTKLTFTDETFDTEECRTVYLPTFIGSLCTDTGARGWVPSDGHCLFISLDCCQRSILRAKVNQSGHICDPEVVDRIVKLRSEISTLALKQLEFAIFYESHPYVAEMVLAMESFCLTKSSPVRQGLLINRAMATLFTERNAKKPTESVDSTLWGCSADIAVAAQLLKTDIYVFSCKKRGHNEWTLCKNTQNQKVPAQYVVRLSEWDTVFQPHHAPGLYIVHEGQHFEPLIEYK